MKNTLLVSMVILLGQLFFCFELKSQVNTDRLTNILTEKGYQNVVVSQRDSSLHVLYENRIFRFEIDGIKKVIESLRELRIEGIKTVRLIILKRGLPIVQAEYPYLANGNPGQDMLGLKSKSRNI